MYADGPLTAYIVGCSLYADVFRVPYAIYYVSTMFFSGAPLERVALDGSVPDVQHPPNQEVR